MTLKKDCFIAECLYAEGHHAEYLYAEGHHAEYCYAEGRFCFYEPS